jgi:hypothetical protein
MAVPVKEVLKSGVKGDVMYPQRKFIGRGGVI